MIGSDIVCPARGMDNCSHTPDRTTVGQRDIILATTRLDLRDFVRREGETALAAEVLDHQLVDIDGARVVRAADLYLATISGTVRLVGVDVGFGSLLRRLGAAQ